MNKFLLFLSSIFVALTLVACENNVNYVDNNNRTDNIESPEASNNTNSIENDETETENNITEDIDVNMNNIDDDTDIDNDINDDETDTNHVSDNDNINEETNDMEMDVDLDNLNIPENPIANEGNFDTSGIPNVQLTKEQFNDFLNDLVENPNPEEGIMFLAASITYEDTIDLTLDLQAGSLEAIWISPIWDLLIRQLYVNSEFQNEPTIIIRDVNGEIISERSEPFSLG